jgi:hypothetical protein
MSKVRALWNKQQRSTSAADVIHDQLHGLFVVENATRWNSCFHSLERIYDFASKDFNGLNSLFAKLGLSKKKISPLTKKEVCVIGEYLQVGCFFCFM